MLGQPAIDVQTDIAGWIYFQRDLALLQDGQEPGVFDGPAAAACRIWRVGLDRSGLEIAYECLQRLNSEMTPALYLRAGDRAMMAARLQRCGRELEMLAGPEPEREPPAHPMAALTGERSSGDFREADESDGNW